MLVDSNLITRDKQKFAGGDTTTYDYLEPLNNDLSALQDDVIDNDEAEPYKEDARPARITR